MPLGLHLRRAWREQMRDKFAFLLKVAEIALARSDFSSARNQDETWTSADYAPS